MVPRGSFACALASVVVLAGVLSHFGAASAAPGRSVSDNAKTLFISVPGPFTGCTFLDPSATPTSNAVLDLIRPSAFLTSGGGTLVGEAGPIASAELTSLQPETVVYTLAPGLTWSNGLVFSGRDLVAWWRHARSLASVQSDGYRAVTSLTLGKRNLSVTAVFARPYADWNLLFRDVEARGAHPGCALSNLVTRPSLGPYTVVSARPTRIVLAMDAQWPNDFNRFGRIVLSTNDALPANVATPFANYSLAVNRGQLQALSAHPSVLSHIGQASSIEEVTFAPGQPLTRRLRMREALSWSLNRQSLLNELWGAVTFSPSVAASAIFSQGQSAYPGVSGSGPAAQSTPPTTTLAPGSGPTGLSDCLACAYDVLKVGHYHRTRDGWRNARGGLLTFTAAVGPSAIDHATAVFVMRQWRHAGIGTRAVTARSDAQAATLAANNRVDVAIYARPTLPAAEYAARSWSGPAYFDTYPGGERSTGVNALFQQASANFNPVSANTSWLALDQMVQTSFWVRPLFTAPSLVEWSGGVTGINNCLSVAGFLDQVTSWSTTTTSHG